MRALISISLLFWLTRFLHANRSSLRSKTLSSISGYRGRKSGHVALRALVRDLLALDHVEHGFSDIGGVSADPLDVLGAEHRVNAERNVARIFHHVGEEFAEQRGAD